MTDCLWMAAVGQERPYREVAYSGRSMALFSRSRHSGQTESVVRSCMNPDHLGRARGSGSMSMYDQAHSWIGCGT